MFKAWTKLILLTSLVWLPTCIVADELAWIGSNSYRTIVSVGPTQSKWKTVPLDIVIDLGQIEKEIDVQASLFILAATEATIRVDFLSRVYEKRKDPVSRDFRQIYVSRCDHNKVKVRFE